jgi:hypothetical protein
MARPDKAASVAELTEQFRSSNAAVLTEYRGLTVAQLKTLRRSLGENAQYAVVKNTLTKIAANEAGITTLDDLFNGPTAVAFVTGDPVESAKGLRDFATSPPVPRIGTSCWPGAGPIGVRTDRIASKARGRTLLGCLAHRPFEVHRSHGLRPG